MNILLVDNTPLYRDILQQSFSNCRGVQLVLVPTQAAAIAAIASQQFDFFVVSWQLPDGSGLDLAKVLRNSGQAPFEPIVLLTSSPSAELAEQANQAGVTELFRKQDVEELVTFVRHFFEMNQPMRCHVLYIEDSKEQRELMDAQLREWGIVVDCFSSADEAWLAFLEHDYDLVLSDIVLAGHMSGARLINRIRRQALPKGGTPILAVTAFDNPSRRIELFQLGIDDYVLKPVIPIELRARLQSLLTRKRATERNRQLLETSSLGVITVDEQGWVRSMDSNALAMFCTTDALFLGKRLDSLLGEEADGILQSLNTGALLVKKKLLTRCCAGKEVSIELSSLEIEAVCGWRQFALLTRNISQELELAANLTRAKEAAELAGRMKAEFLANMSHEIRTPMNAILGMTYMMKRHELAAEQITRVDRIASAGQHLMGIVNDVLDFSKIEAGKMELESIPLSIGVITANVVSMINERASAKGLTLKVVGDVLPAWLMGDPTRLTQALLNYVSNAVKFTERGTITLRTSVLNETEDSLRVCFEVIDQGIGIADASLERIFDAFQQADSSTTRKFGGTGLGLAITRKLASLMGGEAGVRSVLGQGSTFWFTANLQRASNVALEIEPKSGLPAAGEILRKEYRGYRILLVEDDYINREVVLEFLADFCFDLDVAEDGQVAVDLVRNNDYALVFMDMQMPRMDGLQATRTIRELPGRQQLPIVAMTANAFNGDRQRCFDAGMNDFLSKPIDPETLENVLLRWLSQPGARPSS